MLRDRHTDAPRRRPESVRKGARETECESHSQHVTKSGKDTESVTACEVGREPEAELER